MAYYNLSQVKAILGEIKVLNLERPASLDDADITELQSQFNGAGSDSIPLVLRKALTMKAMYIRCVEILRANAILGLNSLVYNMCRLEQITRLKTIKPTTQLADKQ